MVIKINEDLLARAVDAKIRPLLIEQNHLDEKTGNEGYHHGKVIPKAQPLLARNSLEEDARAAAIGAISASVNLVSPHETMQATDFLKGCRPADVRDHTIDLLYGEGALLGRITRFLQWASPREIKVGKNTRMAGLNATAASYLLAVSDPARYAFCKPSVYKAAVRVLLGADQIEKDASQRILHCTEFYKAALELFRTQHGFDRFTDLLYCHVAFYVMDNYEDPPTWDTLTSWQPKAGKKPAPKTAKEEPMASAQHPLNLILYGPPGTGKTYHTIARAVTICDGEIPGERHALSTRFNELRDQGRIEFVTFHQSYGYEEFVEGIRPVLRDEEGESQEGDARSADLRYACMPGVFRRICDAATARATPVHKPVQVDLARHRVWKMSLGDSKKADEADIYDDCIASGQIRLAYGLRQDYSGCDNRAAILARLRQVSGDPKQERHAMIVDWFKNVMKVGDLVVVPDGNRKFRAIGRVTGEYVHLDADDYDQARAVEWLVVLEGGLGVETISRKTFSQKTLYQLREHVLKVDVLGQMLSGKGAGASLPHVLIIDEINRGNISKIFGELITLIEPDKRLGAQNELRVALPFSGDCFGVPANVYIIGTMNTADRSIAFLDTALRRRFRFEEMMPDAQVIRDHVGDDGVIEGVDVAALMEAINRRIELLYDRDHQIGHAYFVNVKSLADLRDVLRYQVIPLLQEYFHDDWSKVCQVLACPCNGETGKRKSNNEHPLIVGVPLDGALLNGDDSPDIEPRVRYEVNDALETLADAELRTCFGALLKGCASAKITGAGADSDEDTDEE